MVDEAALHLGGEWGWLDGYGSMRGYLSYDLVYR